MIDIPCRVNADLNAYDASLWDCECAPSVEPDDTENLCHACLVRHPDYCLDGD